MKLIVLHIIILILSVHLLKAQPAISFQKLQHNFNQVDNLDFKPAAFVFTNTGDKRLVILKTDQQPSVRTTYPRRYIQPDETDTLFAKFISNKEGKFEETIQVFTNASFDAIELSIEGDNVAAAQCFDEPNISLRNPYIRKILVIDQETGKPIPFAEVSYLYNRSKEIVFTVNRKGTATKELKVGLYQTRVSADNYETLYESGYIRKSIPQLVYKLKGQRDEGTKAQSEELVERGSTVAKAMADEEVESEDEAEVENKTQRQEANRQKPEVKGQRDEGTSSFAEASEDKGVEIAENGLPETLYASNNIVFLVDVSLSMKKRKKLELLQLAMKELISVLRKIDKVSLISFSNRDYVLLTAINGNKKRTLTTEIDSLKPIGMTNGVKGLTKAYEMANQYYIRGGNNQIILATDGKFNSPEFSERDLIKTIKLNAANGIITSIVGFGDDETSIKRMQKMARIGEGSYIHISEEKDVAQILVDEIKKNSRITEHTE